MLLFAMKETWLIRRRFGLLLGILETNFRGRKTRKERSIRKSTSTLASAKTVIDLCGNWRLKFENFTVFTRLASKHYNKLHCKKCPRRSLLEDWLESETTQKACSWSWRRFNDQFQLPDFDRLVEVSRELTR